MPDPGYIAESISRTVNGAGWHDNEGSGYGKLTGDTFITADENGLLSGPRNISDYYPELGEDANFISAGYYSESQDKMHFLLIT